MNNKFKIQLIALYFIFFYTLTIPIPGWLNIIIWLFCILFFGFQVKQKELLYKSIIIKNIIFIIIMMIYFVIGVVLLQLSLYSIGDSGGWIRENIYEDINYQFQWYEVLFWNFIYSLYYPVYIYIFFKPFVNYLDSSIVQLKCKQIQNSFLFSFIKVTLSCFFAISVVVIQSYLLGNPGVSVYIAIFVQLFEVYLAIHFYRLFLKLK